MATVSQVLVTQKTTPLYGQAGAGGILLINLDTSNTVYVGYEPNIQAGGSNTIPVGPLASITPEAGQAIYAVADAGQTAQVGLAPGGTQYSPGSLTITGPVTATISGTVDADVTGTVSISSGTVDATVTGTVDISGGSVDVTSGSVTIVENAAAISGIASASLTQVQTGASPADIIDLLDAARVWAVSISCTVNTSSSYSGGRQQAYASVTAAVPAFGDINLLIADIGISGPTQNPNQALSIQLPGFYFPAGTIFQLIVNGGTAITNATIEASATVVYSVP